MASFYDYSVVSVVSVVSVASVASVAILCLEMLLYDALFSYSKLTLMVFVYFDM